MMEPPACQSPLHGPRLGPDFELLESLLVVVGHVFEVLALKHGGLELICGGIEVVQVVAQQGHRYRPTKRREGGETQVLRTRRRCPRAPAPWH